MAFAQFESATQVWAGGGIETRAAPFRPPFPAQNRKRI